MAFGKNYMDQLYGLKLYGIIKEISLDNILPKITGLTIEPLRHEPVHSNAVKKNQN